MNCVQPVACALTETYDMREITSRLDTDKERQDKERDDRCFTFVTFVTGITQSFGNCIGVCSIYSFSVQKWSCKSDNITLWTEKKYIEGSEAAFTNINEPKVIEVLCGLRHKGHECATSIFLGFYLLFFTCNSTYCNEIKIFWYGNLKKLWN